MFVSNVLDGSIVRFDLTYIGGLKVYNQVKIAAGMNNRTDPVAFVLGPSGLAIDAVNDILYVASSADNVIYSIPGALTIESGNPVTPTAVYSDMTHLHGPLNLNLLPNGNLIVANSDGSNVDPNQPSEIVEFTTKGVFVSQMSIDPNEGGAFGMALQSLGPSGLLRFAAVDDVTSSLTMWVTSPTN
jgi:sugar lactone lactonase YvrE